MLSLLIWKWRDEAALLDHFELTNLSIYLQKRVARPPCALGIGGWATGWQLWPREEQETSQPSRTLLRARHLTCLISLHTNTPRGTCNSCPPFTVGTLKPKVVNSLPKITQFLRSEAREDQPHPECSAGAGGRVGSERDPYRDKQGNRVRGKRGLWQASCFTIQFVTRCGQRVTWHTFKGHYPHTGPCGWRALQVSNMAAPDPGPVRGTAFIPPSPNLLTLLSSHCWKQIQPKFEVEVEGGSRN